MPNPEHTTFYCEIRPKGQPSRMRLDPAMFSDRAIKKIIKGQLSYVLNEKASVTMFFANSRGDATALTIKPKGLDGTNKSRRKLLLSSIFEEIRKPDITEVLIRKDFETDSIKRFINHELKDF